MPDIGDLSGSILVTIIWTAFWIFFVAMTLSLILRLHAFLNKALPLLDAVKRLLDQHEAKGRQGHSEEQPDTGS